MASDADLLANRAYVVANGVRNDAGLFGPLNWFNRIMNPTLNDIGITKIEEGTAMDAVAWYAANINKFGGADNLDLMRYVDHPAKLINDMIGNGAATALDAADLSVRVQAVIARQAQDWYQERDSNWSLRSRDEQAALITTFSVLGSAKIAAAYDVATGFGQFPNLYNPSATGDGGAYILFPGNVDLLSGALRGGVTPSTIFDLGAAGEVGGAAIATTLNQTESGVSIMGTADMLRIIDGNGRPLLNVTQANETQTGNSILAFYGYSADGFRVLESSAGLASNGERLYQQFRNSSGGYDVDIPDVDSITGSMLASNPGLRGDGGRGADRPAGAGHPSLFQRHAEREHGAPWRYIHRKRYQRPVQLVVQRGDVVDGGVITTRTVTDTGATITRTRNPGAPADDPDPWAHTVKLPDGTEIAGGEIGSILGSSIGNAIAGGNVFAQIAASSVLGTLLQNVGQTFGTMLDQDVSLENAAYTSFANFDTELAQQVHSAGLGAVSSFLSAELAESLGVHATDFGGQLFSYAASTGINTLLDYTLGNVAKNLNFTDGLSGALFGSGALPDPLALGVSIQPEANRTRDPADACIDEAGDASRAARGRYPDDRRHARDVAMHGFHDVGHTEYRIHGQLCTTS